MMGSQCQNPHGQARVVRIALIYTGVSEYYGSDLGRLHELEEESQFTKESHKGMWNMAG